MKTEVLLVIGSRSFAGHPAAMRWVRSVLLREFADVLERTDRLHLVTGDAEGADYEAEEIARALNCLDDHVSYSIFRLDGVVSHSHVENERWFVGEPPARGTPERKRWPLLRNRAMVARVDAFVGPKVGVALQCPWSTSHGTDQTVGLLRGAKIEVRPYNCPAKLKGKP